MPPTKYKKSAAAVKYGRYELNNSIVKQHLIIVESPKKCKLIEEYIPTATCIATVGHIREIKGLSAIKIKPDSIDITYNIIKRDGSGNEDSRITALRKAIKQMSPDAIYLATDDDREGEAIAWHICDTFKLPVETTKRIVFHEITASAVQHAFQNPRIIDMNLVRAQNARQVLDMLVGFKISPHLRNSVALTADDSLSAGRCQTPALRLVHDHHIARRAAESALTFEWTVKGQFMSPQIVLTYNKSFTDENELCTFLQQTRNLTYTSEIKRELEPRIEQPPLPYNTSALLQDASSLLRMSPKRTTTLLQELYTSGYITYIRTESRQLSPIFCTLARDYIKSTYGSTMFNESAATPGTNALPHEAIRVTQLNVTALPSGLPTDMQTLYRLIWRNGIESLMPPASYTVYKLSVTHELGEYTGKIEIVRNWGWRTVKPPFSQDEQRRLADLVTAFSKFGGAPLEIIATVTNSVSLPPYYTEAGLIKKLEKIGIGRPSTFAHLVEVLSERSYVIKTEVIGITRQVTNYIWSSSSGSVSHQTVNKTFGHELEKLMITPLGELALEFLLQHFDPLFEYDYTRQMEEKLDNTNVTNWTVMCHECLEQIKELTAAMRSNSGGSGGGLQTFPMTDTDVWRIALANGGIILTRRDETLPKGYEIQQTRPGVKIDLERLRAGLYSYSEVAQPENGLGLYLDSPVFIKHGPHGYYIKWRDRNISLRKLTTQAIENMTLAEAIDLIVNGDPSVMRIIDDKISIKRGKFSARFKKEMSPYIQINTDTKNKPQFISLAKFPGDFLECDVADIYSFIATAES